MCITTFANIIRKKCTISSNLLADAERGDAEAQYHLGRAFAYAFQVGQDFEEAVRWYRQAVAQNHPGAHRELGRLYLHGKGILQDIEKGKDLLTKAAQLGDDEACNVMGGAYWRGAFGTLDQREAMAWFLRAAENGDPDGQYNLGLSHETLGNYAQAVHWYRKALNGTHEEAACQLAHLLLEGKGAPQNVDEALRLFELAGGEYQYPLGYFYLAQVHDEGKFVPQDFREAAGYYFLAADEGVASAQLRYAELAELGHGGTDDPHEAYVWGRVALEHLFDDLEITRAEALLARIKSAYGPWQLAEAEKKAKRAIAFLRQVGHC